MEGRSPSAGREDVESDTTAGTPRRTSAPARVSGGRRGRPPFSAEQRQALRLSISRAAIELFSRQGVAATTVEQIAAVGGVSVRTLWRHFDSKEHCAEPLFSMIAERLITVLRRWPASTSLEEHLRSDVRDVDRKLSDAAVVLTRTEPALRAIWLVRLERTEEVLALLLAERLHAEPDDVAIRIHAATLTAVLRISGEIWAIDPSARGDRIGAATMATIFTRALAAAGAGIPDQAGLASTRGSSPGGVRGDA